MADFLSRMIARTQESPSVVRPPMSHRFGPVTSRLQERASTSIFYPQSLDAITGEAFGVSRSAIDTALVSRLLPPTAPVNPLNPFGQARFEPDPFVPNLLVPEPFDRSGEEQTGEEGDRETRERAVREEIAPENPVRLSIPEVGNTNGSELEIKGTNVSVVGVAHPTKSDVSPSSPSPASNVSLRGSANAMPLAAHQPPTPFSPVSPTPPPPLPQPSDHSPSPDRSNPRPDNTPAAKLDLNHDGDLSPNISPRSTVRDQAINRSNDGDGHSIDGFAESASRQSLPHPPAVAESEPKGAMPERIIKPAMPVDEKGGEE